MRVCVPKEIAPNEKRVATTPDTVRLLTKLGFQVAIEANAGQAAGYLDSAYSEAGAEISSNAQQLWSEADILLKVQAPVSEPENPRSEVNLLRPGQTLVAFLWPAQNPELLKLLAEKGVNALAIDAVPRISRAQKLDALSSMANIAGYRAVIEAAHHFGRFFTGQVTAAGKVMPAKFLVIGAGVAGLAAIGAASSLGAIVRAFDTRPEVKDQVKSMGGEFLFLDFEEDGEGAGGYARVMSDEFVRAEMKLFKEQAGEVDIIITTALIPGKPAPKLITEEMVWSMRPGSVIIDLAAEQGGNCVLTEPDAAISVNNVTVIGYTDLPSRMAAQSSQLYANNLYHLLADLCPEKNGDIIFDLDDEVIRAVTTVHNGQILWPPPEPEKNPVIKQNADDAADKALGLPEPSSESKSKRTVKSVVGLGLCLLAILAVGAVAPPSFMTHFTVFVLSIFVGWQVIWNVTPALHTPLMSVTNAISGIIVIGALVQTASSSTLVLALAFFSILIASINISGGFLVTQRMLRMFRKE